MTRLEANCLTFVDAFNEIEHRGPSLGHIKKALRIEKQSAARIVRELIMRHIFVRDATGLHLIPHPESPSTSY